MKAIVIGSNGYIGSHIAYSLKNQGHDVLCLDLPRFSVTDIQSVKSVDWNVDYVYIFAGMTGTYVGFDNYYDYVNINELGLLNLLHVIRNSKYRPRIVFPSSRLVYKGKESPLKETDYKETKTIYAVNKLACEGYLKAFSINFDIPYTIYRLCIPFGNLLGGDYSYGTIGFFIKQAVGNKQITLYGDGKVKRTFTSISDVCTQIIESSFMIESINEIYNIGGVTYSLKEAAMIIASHFNAKIVSVPFPEKDLRMESGSTFFDSSKIERLLKRNRYKILESIFNPSKNEE